MKQRSAEELNKLYQTTEGRKHLLQERADRRTAAAIARVKAQRPGITDEKAKQIIERYPVHSDDEWPLALATWVEHQAPNKKKLTERQRNTLLNIAGYIRENSDNLLADDGTLVKLMRAAYLIGVYCPAPDETLRTHKIRGIKATKVQRRLEAVTPLVLEKAMINRKAIPKRAFEEANKLLKAKGLLSKKKKGISLRTFAGYVSQILADNPE